MGPPFLSWNLPSPSLGDLRTWLKSNGASSPWNGRHHCRNGKKEKIPAYECFADERIPAQEKITVRDLRSEEQPVCERFWITVPGRISVTILYTLLIRSIAAGPPTQLSALTPFRSEFSQGLLSFGKHPWIVLVLFFHKREGPVKKKLIVFILLTNAQDALTFAAERVEGGSFQFRVPSARGGCRV